MKRHPSRPRRKPRAAEGVGAVVVSSSASSSARPRRSPSRCNGILAIAVDTYIEDVADTVSLAVAYGTFGDGITYQSEMVLEAPSQNVTVTIQNSGHRRVAQ